METHRPLWVQPLIGNHQAASQQHMQGRRPVSRVVRHRRRFLILATRRPADVQNCTTFQVVELQFRSFLYSRLYYLKISMGK